MEDSLILKEKLFSLLHQDEKLLVLPNIWDPLGACLLEKLGYKAAATGSAAIANTNGFQDGEIFPFEELLSTLQRIVKSVKIPVTADVERGYSDNKSTLTENIKKLIDTGIVGINYEDSHHNQRELITVNKQTEFIHLIKKTAESIGSNLFVNARTDSYIKANNFTDEEKLMETIQRGKAYQAAGADGFYPIFLKDKKSIAAILDEVSLPLNILLSAGIPDFNELKELGVARLSLGSGLLKMALLAMKTSAQKLLNFTGMEDIISNPIQNDWIAGLIADQ
jgi:2-methylisocitrate lyase-like PEP mutase family enzyme